MAATILAATILTTSCEKNENITDTAGAVNILASVSGGTAETRTATDAAYAPVDGKQLFLFYKGVDNAAVKEQTAYTYTAASGWAANPIIYWDNLAFVDESNPEYPFFAVAPQVPVVAPLIPAVSVDQSDLAIYTTSDQLVAFATATDETVALPLTFKHVLSQIMINLTTADSEESGVVVEGVALSTAALKIAGVNRFYTLDYSTATSAIPAVANAYVAVVDPIPAPEIPASLVPYMVSFTDGATPKKVFKAVLPAQTFAVGALTLTFTISGKVYTWSNDKEIASVAGKNTNISLHITKTEIKLIADGIEVTGWDETVEPVNGGIEL
jgi:hypothetical protein